ncbi:putative citrate (Si)-synthase [Streptomyces sp. Tu6071]|nr:putative citrate (Si)-synthase [Streptomyces sp. Tu6071]
MTQKRARWATVALGESVLAARPFRPGHTVARATKSVGAARAGSSRSGTRSPPDHCETRSSEMSDFVPGLEGVIAFETEIAEPDKEGGALRYRGVDIEDLVGKVSFGNVWGLLVDGSFTPGLPPAEPFPLPVHTGDIRVDVQSALAQLAPIWGLRPLLDIDAAQARTDLARSAVTALSYVAQAARGQQSPMVPQSEIDKGRSIVERFMIRWRGEPDPRHVKAVDAYWTSAAEHGMNASTFTARVIASTGADVAAALSGAVGAMSGPLHGGAPSRVLGMLEEVERTGDAAAYVRRVLDSGERLMGFGHRVYRAEDPRARVLRRTAKELGAPRFEVAEALEKAALDELHSRRPDRVLATNVEFWAAIMLDFAEVPAPLFTSMFTCARTAGWSAHILEQKRTGRLVRPSARYTGPGSRTAEDIEGYGDVVRVDG